jgi:hypothetical protein
VATPHRAGLGLNIHIEGSTRRWEVDADGMWTALFEHDEVLPGQPRP